MYERLEKRVEEKKRINSILNKITKRKSKCCDARVIYDAVGGYKYANTVKKCTNCGAKIFKELN